MLIAYKKPRGRFFIVGKGGSGPVPPTPSQPDDEIWYTSTDDQVVTPTQPGGILDENGNALNILSNTYSDGKGVIKLDGDVASFVPVGSDGVFDSCATLASVSIPDSVTSIGNYTFYGCSRLASVTIGNSVTSIGNSAFQGCNNLAYVNYTGTVDQWCEIDFANNSSNPTRYAKTLSINGSLLTEVVISDTVTAIGKYAFYNCENITSVTVGNSVTTIGFGAFSGCSGMTSATIGSSVTTVGDNAFAKCTSLVAIESLPTTAPSISSFTFQNVGQNGVLTVHNADYSTWMSTGNYYLGKYNWTCEGMAYAVSISASSNGSVSVDDVPGDFNDMVPIGTQLTLLATPDQDYVFDTWSDGDNSNPKSAVVDSPITLTASFTPDVVYHTVTVLANANADISVDGTQISGDTQFTVAEGQQMVFSISAHSGWYFSATMFSDGTETDYNNPSTYTLGQSDVTVSFEIQHFRTITLVTNDSSMGLVGFSGEIPAATTTKTGVYDGSCEDMYAYPETDYTFVRWESNDITIDSPTDNPSYSCGGSGTITAVFQAVTPQSQPNDEFWYTTSDGNMMTVSSPFDANIVSHTYTNGKGIIKCDSNITTVNINAFNKQLTLETFSLPDSVTTINKNAFSMSAGANSSLLSCEIGSGVTSIGNYGFSNNVNCTSFTIYATTPPTIGTTIFYNNSNMAIYVPAASVEDYKAASGWSSYRSRIQAIQ